MNDICIFTIKIMRKYKTLLIDDNPEHINLLKSTINLYIPLLDVVAEASDVQTGIQEYLKTQPEILLLDVNLENDTIFSFIDELKTTSTEIILISSHNHYGVTAVNYNVTGYVMKPIKVQKLKKAIQKAIFNIERKTSQNNFSFSKQNEITHSSIISIPGIQDVALISSEEIEYLEADGKYTVVHLSNQTKKVSSKNIGEYESFVNPKLFYRVHHRYLVNISKIIRIHKSGKPVCELANKVLVPIAKRRLESLYQFLNVK